MSAAPALVATMSFAQRACVRAASRNRRTAGRTWPSVRHSLRGMGVLTEIDTLTPLGIEAKAIIMRESNNG